MKLLVVLFLLFAHSTAFAIGAAYSGSWYNPDQDGHGFSIEYSVLDDGTPIFIAYWYVYDTEGNPIFLIGVGQPNGDNTVDLEFEAPYGMKFGDFGPNPTREDGGTGTFAFEDSETGTFDYQPSSWITSAYGVTAISIPVRKITGVDHPNPEVVEVHIGAELLTTTERTGDFPVCFNGRGELLPCADDIDPTKGDPYAGSWSGRMVYDRESAAGDACWDSDVEVVVYTTSVGTRYTQSMTFRPDVGGLYIKDVRDNVTSTGTVNGYLSNVNGQDMDFTISFNTQGSAQGAWTYKNSDCYGEWSFSKD